MPPRKQNKGGAAAPSSPVAVADADTAPAPARAVPRVGHKPAIDITPATIVKQPVEVVMALLSARRYFPLVAGLLAFGNLLLGALIILKVPYTKIDWDAYMQQVDMFISGERDYSKIEGETGPLVYPALHLYIYTLLHDILPAHGRERPAQWIFLFVELTTFLLVASIYYLAGRRRHIPQWLLIPLVLSKRSHSIYLLRLFNDPLAMVILYASVLAFMTGWWKVGSLVYSLALGVKMNILLFLPGLLVILFQARGFFGTLDSLVIIGFVQIGLPGVNFFETGDQIRAYYHSAFDFSRQFLYKWTVNWKFVSEETFLSSTFAKALLVGHLSVLVAFGLYRWSPFPGGTFGVLGRGLRPLRAMFQPPVPENMMPSEHIPLVLFTSNLIGMAFARSLHYQFHAWYFHQLPLLLYLGGAWGEVPVLIGILALLERAWDTYPATPGSSSMIAVCHGVMILGLWLKGPRLARAAVQEDANKDE